MATIHKTDIDLDKNQIYNHRLHNTATTPSSPAVGQIIYNTTLNEPLVWTGSVWKSLFSTTQNTIYTGNGTLTGTRTITLSGSSSLHYLRIQNSNNQFVFVANGDQLVVVNKLQILNPLTTTPIKMLGIDNTGSVTEVDSVISIQDLTDMRDLRYWTIELVEAMDVTFYISETCKFNNITTVQSFNNGTPSITITRNGSSYGFGQTLNVGDEIKITSNIFCVIKINGSKV